jgi:hypothetical protein
MGAIRIIAELPTPDMIYLDPAALKRGSGSSNLEHQPPVSAARLSEARLILRHSTELAQDVLTRGEHLDVALRAGQDPQESRRLALAMRRGTGRPVHLHDPP